jgi:DNA topoisomerase-2
MHLFNENNSIRKYNNVVEIMDNFYTVRYEHYVKRKNYLLGELSKEISILEQKVRFLDCVIKREIDVGRQTVEELEAILKQMGFLEIAIDDAKTPSYNYLIDIKIRSITVDTFSNLKRLLESKQNDFQTLTLTTIENLWKREIEEFMESYVQCQANIEHEEQEEVPKKKVSKKITVRSK